jgi:hypothetical protein
MILMSFAVGGLWFIYGIMLADNFIKIPNFLGFALGTIQVTFLILILSIVLMGITHFVKNHFVESFSLGQV